MGNVVQDSSVKSSASEAVFTKTGSVKKRIRNYETTVVDTSEKVLVFPPKPESNREPDLTEVMDTVDALGADSPLKNRKPVRHGALLIGFIVMLTFSWSLYSIFFSVKQDELVASTEPTQSSAKKGGDTHVEDKLALLQESANELVDGANWNKENIDAFLRQWNQLNNSEIQQITSSTWYQLLEYKVKKQVSYLRDPASGINASTKADQSLLTLGLVMGVLEPGNQDVEDQTNDHQQLLAELTRELQVADKRSSKTLASDVLLYEQLKEKYASRRPIVTPGNTKIEKENVTKIKPPARPQVTEHARLKKRQRIISQQEIKQVVANYKKAFEEGDLKLMAQLFGTTDLSSNTYRSVAGNFSSTFDNTSNRTINFYDTKSRTTTDKVVVDGKFNSSLEFKNGKGVQYTVANMKMHLTRLQDKIIINRVNVSDKQVNVVSNKPARVTSSHGMITSLDNKISIPTAAELQDVTTQLVTSYETGDLEQFLSLFSSEIKTNDRIDIDGVKKDYQELFSSTSDRQMFIQNLKWSKENIGAKGTGDLEVVILSDEGKTVYSMEGKIQIIAQKLNNKVKITHLYHIEREK